MKGSAEYAWDGPISLDQAGPDISFRQAAAAASDPSFLSSGISPRQQLRWHFSEVSSANIVPSTQPATQSENLKMKGVTAIWGCLI